MNFVEITIIDVEFYSLNLTMVGSNMFIIIQNAGTSKSIESDQKLCVNNKISINQTFKFKTKKLINEKFLVGVFLRNKDIQYLPISNCKIELKLLNLNNQGNGEIPLRSYEDNSSIGVIRFFIQITNNDQNNKEYIFQPSISTNSNQQISSQNQTSNNSPAKALDSKFNGKPRTSNIGQYTPINSDLNYDVDLDSFKKRGHSRSLIAKRKNAQLLQAGTGKTLNEIKNSEKNSLINKRLEEIKADPRFSMYKTILAKNEEALSKAKQDGLIKNGKLTKELSLITTNLLEEAIISTRKLIEDVKNLPIPLKTNL